MSLNEELNFIASMYGNPKEFIRHENLSAYAGFAMNLEMEDNQMLKFNCQIHEGYPLTVPTVYIQFPSLQRSMNAKLQQDLHDYLKSNELIGQPLLCILIDWLKENVCNYSKNIVTKDISSSLKPLETKVSACVLLLDHMRSKCRYIKHLQTFAKELNVCGYMLFATKLIFIILLGFDDSIKEFIVKLKAQKVDLDSAGHPCKERMLKILGSICDSRISTFGNHLIVEEFDNYSNLENFFVEKKIDNLYKKFVKPNLILAKSSH